MAKIKLAENPEDVTEEDLLEERPEEVPARMDRVEKALSDQADLLLSLTKAVTNFVKQNGNEVEEEEAPVVPEDEELKKDDSSSNFGEKPGSDIPANPEVDPDKVKVDETLLSKTAATVMELKKQVASLVKQTSPEVLSKAMGQAGFVQAGVVPGTGSVRPVERGPGAGDVMSSEDRIKLEEQAKSLSFKEIADMRVKMGDLPMSVI